MALTEKTAYLKGLADGMKLNAEKDNTDKMLLAIIDTLGEIAKTVDDMDCDLDEFTDQLDAVDEDLADLEGYVYDYDDDCCGCEDDCCDCDDDCLEVTCPSCGEEFSIDFDIYEEGHVSCPNCGEELEFDFDDDDSDKPEGADIED